MDEKRIRETLKDKQRIVFKIGSSSIIHEETGGTDYRKLETLVRIICDLKNQGKDVVLVSSGAIGVGFEMLGLRNKPKTVSLKPGVCGNWPGTAYDDLSEAIYGI